jgi:LysM repeat protein
MAINKNNILLSFFLFLTTTIVANTLHTDIQPTDSVNSSFAALAPLKKMIADSVINYGKLYLNTPYRYGTGGPSSFDCSGFTSFVYRNFGVDLDRSSAGQAKQVPNIAKHEIKPGDLVFFAGHRRGTRVGHVGIVTETKENGEFDFIHASTNDGVVISNSKSDYYSKRYISAGRVSTPDSLLAAHPITNRSEYVSNVPSETIKKTIPAKYHYVRKGENLSEIASKYGMTVAQLKKRNNLTSSNLQVKQRLLIKEKEVVSIVQPISANSNQIANNLSVNKTDSILEPVCLSATKHTVTKGETLFSIAKKYDISVAELKRINKLDNSNVFSGQTLQLSENNSEKIIAKQPISHTDTIHKKSVARNNSDNKILTHKVKSGESLITIARKYHTTVETLKELNGMSGNFVDLGQEIIICGENVEAKLEEIKKANEIRKNEYLEKQHKAELANNNVTIEVPTTVEPTPKHIDKPANVSTQSKTETEINEESTVTHKVLKGESLFSISQKYNTTVDVIKKNNNLSKGKIFPGQILNISGSTVDIVTNAKSTENKVNENKVDPVKASNKTSYNTHTVKSGENLGIIAKKYNSTVAEIKKLNGLTGSSLQVGQKLKVNSNSESEVIINEEITESENTEIKEKSTKPSITNHKVQRGESLYSIAKRYNLTIDELKELNNLQSSDLQVGQKIKVSASENSTKAKVKKEPKSTTYTVRKGDNYSTIAQKFGCSTSELKKWNNKTNDRLDIGDKLTIHTGK